MDRQRIEEFFDRFLGLASGATTMALLAVADRSGLTAYLWDHPGQTSSEIASGAGLEERYVAEILAGLAAAGVVDYDPAAGTFTLPPEHALFVADETSPYFMGGWMDMIPVLVAQVDGVAKATSDGGGVPFEEFGGEAVAAIERANSPSQRVFLTGRWLGAVPGLAERLEGGIDVADIGCGSGTAALLMAQAYPRSLVRGFDPSRLSIAAARRRGEGVENLEFHELGAEEIPVEPGFDLITAFDVIHDLADPLAGLARIREALRTDGMFIMMEPNMSSDLAENLHPLGAMMYGVSTLHCLTQSLARGGAGLGAAWGSARAEEMARAAGFGSFQELEEIGNRFSRFYLMRA